MAVAGVLGSTLLHKQLLYNVLRSPVLFFDITPLGRIINRFSKDVDSIDSIIPKTLTWCIKISVDVTATVFVISYSTPIFLSVLLPLTVIYFFVQVTLRRREQPSSLPLCVCVSLCLCVTVCTCCAVCVRLWACNRHCLCSASLCSTVFIHGNTAVSIVAHCC